MPHSYHVIVANADSYAPPVPLTELVTETGRRNANTDARWIVVPEELTLAAEAIDAEECASDSGIRLWPLSESSGFSDIWAALPSPLATRVHSPTDVVAMIPEGVANEAGWRDVSDPLWDLLIRIADEGATIRVVSPPVSIDPIAPRWQAPQLAPARPAAEQKWLRDHLAGCSLPGSGDNVESTALKAGLLQIHDELDASHQQSQSIEGEGRHRNGDYWHAIMHRREPDYGNSKYWFRSVGTHPIFPELATETDRILEQCQDSQAAAWRQKLTALNGWDPRAFVDLCEAVATGEDTPLGLAARRIQWAEMRLLLVQTYRDTVAG